MQGISTLMQIVYIERLGFKVLVQYFYSKTLDVHTFLLPLCRNGMRVGWS
jgi:hypothetical protein